MTNRQQVLTDSDIEEHKARLQAIASEYGQYRVRHVDDDFFTIYPTDGAKYGVTGNIESDDWMIVFADDGSEVDADLYFDNAQDALDATQGLI